MEPWLTHTITALGAFLVGLAPILRQWRKDHFDQQTAIIADLRQRIGQLETRTEALHADRAEALKRETVLVQKVADQQAEIVQLKSEIAELERQLGRPA